MSCPPHHWKIVSEKIVKAHGYAQGTQNAICILCAAKETLPVKTYIGRTEHPGVAWWEIYGKKLQDEANYKTWLEESEEGSFNDI